MRLPKKFPFIFRMLPYFIGNILALLACMVSPAAGAAAGAAAGVAASVTDVALWPTIPFMRGQDLCAYEDAYGRSRIALMRGMTREIKELVMLGGYAKEAVEALQLIDGLIDKNRRLASAGMGMDVTLEGALKAAIDQLYRQVQSRQIRLRFVNPGSVSGLLHELKELKRRGTLDPVQLSRISGIAWGTYALAPGCKGGILLTLHVELRSGETRNFSATGSLEQAVGSVAVQMVRAYQATQFPSTVNINGKALTLVGAPGTPVSHSPSPQLAERACASLKARLPTQEEYEQLAILGDWNGGVSLSHDVWTLAGGLVLAPDLRNPSPVRKPESVPGEDLHFYCVR